MKIAIIGAGFVGLAVAWHLLEKGGNEVVLFDPKGVGGGASGVATGLMHPYVGEGARRSDLSDEGLRATHALLDLSEQTLGIPVCSRGGILRIAQSEKQLKQLRAHVNEYGDVEEISPGHFLITSGVTVYCRRYLEGLMAAIEKKGGRLVQEAVTGSQSLSEFDRIVIAAGAGIRGFTECSLLPVNFVKGQILRCKVPIARAPFERSIIGKGSVGMSEDPSYCYLGATYEKGVVTDFPDIEVAKAQLLPKISRFFPEAGSLEMEGCWAGIRVTKRGHYFPVIAEVRTGVWVITGLGSRGLLYHGYIASQLVIE